jgi:hypothetical protein
MYRQRLLLSGARPARRLLLEAARSDKSSSTSSAAGALLFLFPLSRIGTALRMGNGFCAPLVGEARLNLASCWRSVDTEIDIHISYSTHTRRFHSKFSFNRLHDYSYN